MATHRTGWGALAARARERRLLGPLRRAQCHALQREGACRQHHRAALAPATGEDRWKGGEPCSARARTGADCEVRTSRQIPDPCVVCSSLVVLKFLMKGNPPTHPARTTMAMATPSPSTRIAPRSAHHTAVAMPRNAVVAVQAKASAHVAGRSSRLASPPTAQPLFRAAHVRSDSHTLARGFLDKLFGGGGASGEKADAFSLASGGQEASDLEMCPFMEDIVEGAHARRSQPMAACNNALYILVGYRVLGAQEGECELGGVDDHLIVFAGTFLEGRTLKLAYKATRDGFSCLKFHERCDYKGPCVVLCTTKDGLRCGGFNPQGAMWRPRRLPARSFVLLCSRHTRVPPHGLKLVWWLGRLDRL